VIRDESAIIPAERTQCRWSTHNRSTFHQLCTRINYPVTNVRASIACGPHSLERSRILAMAQTTAPIFRSMTRRLRAHWRGIVVAGAIVLIFGSIALTMLNNQSWHADGLYQAAAAEADRLDPGWRLDDILAGREKLSDEQNSVLRVRDIVGKLPGGWPGIKHYDSSFLYGGENPEVRLSQARIDDLRYVFEGKEDIAHSARLLADYPRGQLDGVRPKGERLEQVGGLNALVDLNFPFGDDVRRVIFLLRLDAQLRIDSGEIDTAITDLRAMVNAGRSIGDYPGLSAQMSRSSGFAQAVPCLETALAQGQAGSSSLAALQSILEDESREPSRTIAIRGERAIIDDTMELIHAGKLDRSAIPSFSDYPFWSKALSNRINIRENQATVLRIHTQAAEAGRLPESEQIAAMKAIDDQWVKKATQWGFLERERRLTERLQFGRMTGVPTWLGITDAQIRTAIAALAAERFRMDQGRWPDSLDQLVPKYIPTVPRDPFENAPLKLVKLPDGLFIYSVGYDGKDDGGKINPRNRMADGADTGFRLWNVDRRRQATGTSSAGKPGSDKKPAPLPANGPSVFRSSRRYLSIGS
jgi:hypothetical protein